MAYTKDIGLRNFYEHYAEAAIRKNRPFMNYKKFSSVLKDAHLLIRSKVVDKSEIFTAPYKIGDFFIHKFSVSYTEDNIKTWRVNYKVFKDTGQIVYHGSPYGYKWKWDKRVAKLSGKKYYQFKPCRKASRLIAVAVNINNVDYYN
jgi:hypothetical protein